MILGFSDGANIAMRFAMKHPDMVTALILNGGNLDAKGVKRSTQLPIEIGYKIAKYFAKRSAEANKNAELLGLMVNDPDIEPEELGTDYRTDPRNLWDKRHDPGRPHEKNCGKYSECPSGDPRGGSFCCK